MENTSGKFNKFLFFGLIIFAAGFFLSVNINSPITGEDISLSYLLKPDYASKPVAGKIQAICSAITVQSLGWNARLGEQLAIIFLGMPRQAFAVVNTFMALAFFYLLFYFAFGRGPGPSKQVDLFCLTLFFSSVILFMPVLGELFFLRNTATNYLWACNILLFFALPYRLYAAGTDIFKTKPAIIPLYILLGFFAGMTNENTGIALLCAVFFLAALRLFKKLPLPAWYYLGAAALICGIAYLFLSPSTAVRIKYYSLIHHSEDSAFTAFFSRLLNVLKRFIWKGAPLLLAFFAAFYAYIKLNYKAIASYLSKKKIIPPELSLTFLLLIITCFSFISTAVLALAPYHETRSLMLTYTCVLISTVRMSSALFTNNIKKIRFPLLILAVALFISAAGYSAMVLFNYTVFNRECTERDAKIRRLAANGEKDIIVEPFKTKTHRYLNTREEYLMWAEQYPLYYGVKNIKYSSK